MSITLFGSAANPADNATLYDSVERSITPPASMVVGDLVRLVVHRRTLDDITMSNLGGQSWTAGTLRQNGSSSSKRFYCRFNGTWSANPSIISLASATVVIQLKMDVARPTTGSNTWAIDVAESFHAVSPPVSPYDVTATGRTTIAANTITFADFFSTSINTWGIQTAGWSNAGGAQYRNPDFATSRSISVSTAIKILTAAAATGNVTNRQTTFGGKAGHWAIDTYKEQSSGVTIGSISTGSTPILHGQTSVTITGTSFGATHTGSADIIISPTDNIADGAAIVQTQTAWADTSVTFTAVLSSFSRFTNLYLFVKNSSGASNSSGFVIQRGSVASFALQLKNLAGSNAASLSGIKYAIYPTTDVFGTAISSGSSATTDGSGNLAGLTSYTLVSGGPVSVGDDVVLIPWKGGSPASASAGTIYQITPTYS